MSSDQTISIVDDDEAVRDSLDVLLRAAGYHTSSFEGCAEFLAGLQSGHPDCILLDVRLPDGDGIDILQKLINDGVRTPVIIITGHGDVPMAVKAMRLGAADFVEKPFDPDVLLNSIERSIQQSEERTKNEAAEAEARERLEALTPREREVMQQLLLGRPNKVIAHELGLSPRTVEVHRARVMEKTAAGSLSELVRIAISAGVDPSSAT